MAQDSETSTRKIILTMLKTSGPFSVSDMAKELGITEMAVRRHLNTLDRDGLLQSKLVRQGMGRPAQVYSLTSQADDLFPKKYQQLTLELLDMLAADLGKEWVQELFDKRKERMYFSYKLFMEGKTLSDKVSALAKIQNENGYMVEWEPVGEETYELKEFNCPIAQVANEYEHACACELSLFESLLEAKVERKECLAKGGQCCKYTIQKKVRHNER
ncbi:metalloregulator ArsR/SmtB family transcription factor [Paenibacillus larvae]|uniref:helix-turn-helix transcriptional regulator n=1 Tax=Paenibacillus larvae TaxID=1464 RepID=UPI0028908054|nr:metalloregulator ArsR/SmtB family transcription factor [Paenibacillus larvae]MDT2193184.1 transcriptional regulator [Paenibacillus larvae]MDT2236429.1 transcriptional regulator [Paenibacillus larvae]MDT2240482.1 transcriptional regulator [Paenibacillus larvae]MDT2247106.1 transcriptional regulator [Paenibacillus larvae]MDT2256136.1 transcriptional regulator [Paenibacillus larvae]